MKDWLLKKDRAGYNNLMCLVSCSVLIVLITLLITTL